MAINRKQFNRLIDVRLIATKKKKQKISNSIQFQKIAKKKQKKNNFQKISKKKGQFHEWMDEFQNEGPLLFDYFINRLFFRLIDYTF